MRLVSAAACLSWAGPELPCLGGGMLASCRRDRGLVTFLMWLR